MSKSVINRIIWAIKQVLALFLPGLAGDGKGSLGRWVINRSGVVKKSLISKIARHYKSKSYPFDPKFFMALLQDYDAPNTFNDWLLIGFEGELYKCKVTGEGGKWTKKQRLKYNFTGWPGRWLPGFYKSAFCYSRYGRKPFTFLDMPALANTKPVTMLNLDSGKKRNSAGCHIHGRRGLSDLVGVSSAGCIVPKRGAAIEMIVRLAKESHIVKKRGLRARFDLAVFLLSDFPDITGVRKI